MGRRGKRREGVQEKGRERERKGTEREQEMEGGGEEREKRAVYKLCRRDIILDKSPAC